MAESSCGAHPGPTEAIGPIRPRRAPIGSRSEPRLHERREHLLPPPGRTTDRSARSRVRRVPASTILMWSMYDDNRANDPGARGGFAMEYLVNMTTHVPEGTTDEAVQ